MGRLSTTFAQLQSKPTMIANYSGQGKSQADRCENVRLQVELQTDLSGPRYGIGLSLAFGGSDCYIWSPL